MLAAMSPWLLAVIAFAAGLAIGAGVVWYLSHRGREGGENARRLRHELDRYRQEVGEHFGETAELVHSLDRSYRSVYEHLEKGAARLVGRDAPQALPREASDGDAGPEVAPPPLPADPDDGGDTRT